MPSLVDSALWTVHLVTAATWVGSVVFLTWGVLPAAAAREGTVDATSLERIVSRLTNLSRAATLVTFLTGAHMAITWYGVGGLLGGLRGYLVLGMVALWLALAGVVEVAGARLTDGLSERKVREPTRSALRLYRGATGIGVLLFVDAGAVFALGYL
jgi:uncharacterized membrane protein